MWDSGCVEKAHPDSGAADFVSLQAKRITSGRRISQGKKFNMRRTGKINERPECGPSIRLTHLGDQGLGGHTHLEDLPETLYRHDHRHLRRSCRHIERGSQ